MHPKLSKAWTLLREIASDWSEHRAGQLGAALAYYSVFSLGPLLLISITVASVFFGEKAVTGELYGTLSNYVGSSGASAIQGLVAGARLKAGDGSYRAIISIGLLIFTATAVVIQLKEALNIIWSVPSQQRAGVHAIVRRYLMSIVTVLSLGFLLLASLVASTVLAFFTKYLDSTLPISADVLEFLNTFVSFCSVMLIFALMFRFFPDTHTEWQDVWIGAAGTALLFTVGKTLIGYYLGRQSLESSYGAAGSFILLLLWVYYSAQLVFLGAEFTQVYSRMYGSRAPQFLDQQSEDAQTRRGRRPNMRLVGGTLDSPRERPH